MENEERSKKSIVFFVSTESTLAGGDHPDSVLILDDKLIRSALEKDGYSVEIKLWDADLPHDEKSKINSSSSGSNNQELFSNPLCIVRSIWNWVECYSEFRNFLQRGIDSTPSLPLLGDFQGVKLCSYKKYLPQFGELLTDSGDGSEDPLIQEKLIPIVPTVFVQKKKGASLKRLKMIAAAKGWSQVVLKPAVGGRGDGVERIDFRREVPNDVANYFDAQLEIADHLLQPFLPEVMRQGEKCLVFIGGNFAHAVRKIPDGWRDEALSQGQKPTNEKNNEKPNTNQNNSAGVVEDSVEDESGDHPVEVFTPDENLLSIAKKVLDQIPDGPPLFARVDFLPLVDTTSGSQTSNSEKVQWVFSEFEVSWPDLFLRACPKSAQLIPPAIDMFLVQVGTGEPSSKRRKT